jgi:hypothetical protein
VPNRSRARRAQRPPAELCQTPVSGGVRRQRGQHGLRFVGVEEEADAAGQQQGRRWRLLAAVQFARGEQDEAQGEQGEQAAGQSCRLMQGSSQEQITAGCGYPVVEGGVGVGAAGEASVSQWPFAIRSWTTPMVTASSCFQGSWPVSPAST